MYRLRFLHRIHTYVYIYAYICYLSLFPFLITAIFAMSLKILSLSMAPKYFITRMNYNFLIVFLCSLSHAAGALLMTQISFQKNVPNYLCFLVQDHTQVTACIIWGVRLEQLVGDTWWFPLREYPEVEQSLFEDILWLNSLRGDYYCFENTNLAPFQCEQWA